MEVRIAGPADQQPVCRLWDMLLGFYGKKADWETLTSSFQFVVANPERVLVFIILIEGVVTGTASLHLGRYSTWYGNWYGHIEDVIIDPDYRGRGLAGTLLQAVIEAARERGLARIELSALTDNENARRTYERVGFETDSVAYTLYL